MPPLSGLNYGIIPNFTIFSAAGKFGGPTTLPNSLNISRNALFLNIEAVSEEVLNIFPIWSYVGSSGTILKGDHLRTIPTKFGPNWPRSFREEDF